MKVVKLSALPTGRLYPPGNIPGTHFCQRLSQTQGHSAARRIVSMKNSNDTIGNRTRDLRACSAVPQPTAPPRTQLTAVPGLRMSGAATSHSFGDLAQLRPNFVFLRNTTPLPIC